MIMVMVTTTTTAIIIIMMITTMAAIRVMMICGTLSCDTYKNGGAKIAVRQICGVRNISSNS